MNFSDDDDDELTIKLCKFGGLLALFICAPVYVFILVSVYKKDIGAGGSTSVGLPDKANTAIFLLIMWFGIWMCQKGYGWFKKSE